MSSAPSLTTVKLSAKELFQKYDEDKSGKISFSEFQKMLPDLGIHLSIPKQIEYFQLCDQDGNGQIDYEEFKVALFVCDTEEVNYAGFNAGTILRPKDAFEMFDKDDSGRIDEEEFHFLLKYLNIEIDEDTHEKMFLKYDLDKSGFIEYPEFKKAWLRLANTRKELEDRGIDVPTLATRFQMINMLEKTLEEEEKQEKLAIEETKRWRRNQERLKLKREYILKAKHQAKVELCNALDAGGSVCVFGNGTLDQFTKTPRKNMNTSFFHQEGYDLLTSLWNLRVGGRSSNEYSNSSGGKVPSVKDDLELNMEGGEGSGNMKGFVHFDKGLNIQRNTVWLWGRQCKGVAISESVILAYCQGGSLYSWGGVDQWWHQLEAESCWQTRTRGEMTARSSDLLGCPIDSRSESFPASDHSSRYDPNKYMSESDELSRKIKTVLQYYNMWSIPDGLVDLLDHAKKCLRNNVERQRVAKSLHLRGKATENLTKMEMVKILYNDIMLEHKLLGEPAHLELRELEREVVELIQQRKLKLAKRRQYKFMEKWRLLGEAQRLDAKNISGGIDNESEIRINSPNDSKHSAMVKRLKDQDEVDLESLMTGEIVISGITPRGPRPKTVPPTSQWKMIDAGSNHAGILDNKDRLHMWGLNATGRLGLVEFKEEVTESKTLQKFHPKAIDLPNVRQFSCGHSHTAAVNTDGDLFLWGSASCGKLGLGDVTSRQECYSPIPMQLKNLSSKKITVVSCGASHTACVESEGGLFVWGNGGGGRLGLGHRRDVLAPMLVKTIQERIVSVSCGNCQTLAITAIDRSTEICNQSKVETVTGGKLYVAGPAEVLGASYSTFDIYESFSLGIDGTQTINPPIIDQISAGFSHQSAISIDGELFLWGDNTKGCCGQDDTKAHFISIPTRVNLYTKPKDLAAGRPTMRRSVSYGNQPFFDIDLDQVAAIREIKLWNCLKVPDNPAIKKKTFTGRLFPCWIMIAHEPFPESVGEGQLEAALKFSIAKKRFDQNLHESIWCPPRGTKGRYIRIQMEGLNLMEFDKLQVFGSYDADTLEKVVSSTCGKRVTAAIVGSTENMEDIAMSYKRAVTADPYHAKILRQLDIYRDIERRLIKSEPTLLSPPISSVGCLLCSGRILCPFCQLKNDFRDVLSVYSDTFTSPTSTPSNRYYLESIVNAILKSE